MASREEIRGYTNQLWGNEMPKSNFLWQNYQNALTGDQANYGNLMSGYSNFANTGGFSGQDLQNIRSRAISPIRSVYSSARREVDRSKALNGGYSPGYGTLMSRLAREQGQATADASTNAEAMIAELLQRGKLAGLSGGSSLYGTSPGMSSMLGQQSLSQSGLLNDILRSKIAGEQLPGKWDSIFGKIGDVIGLAGKIGTAAGSF